MEEGLEQEAGTGGLGQDPAGQVGGGRQVARPPTMAAPAPPPTVAAPARPHTHSSTSPRLAKLSSRVLT